MARIQDQSPTTDVSGKYVAVDSVLGTQRALTQDIAATYVPVPGSVLQEFEVHPLSNDKNDNTVEANTAITLTIMPQQIGSKIKLEAVFPTIVTNSNGTPVLTAIRSGEFEIWRTTGTPGQVSFIKVGRVLTAASTELNDTYGSQCLMGEDNSTSLLAHTYVIRFKSDIEKVAVETRGATSKGTYFKVIERAV